MYHLTSHIKVHERKDWGARAPRAMDRQGDPTEAFVHHGAEGDAEAHAVTTQSQLLAAMRGVQNFHMNTRGWADIAYHYVVFQPHGRLRYAHICEGRLVHNVPAAQLNHNTGTLAICVFGTIDSGDALHDSTVDAIAALLTGQRSNLTGIGGIKTVGGHRDVTQTDCPGDTLYHALDRIAHAANIRRYNP